MHPLPGVTTGHAEVEVVGNAKDRCVKKWARGDLEA